MANHDSAQIFLAELAANPPPLPFEPSLLTELFERTGADFRSDSEGVAKLLERSQNLAARVLRLANSAYYGFSSAVSSLPQAVRVLGMAEIRNMVLGIGAGTAFRKADMPPGFNMEAVWAHQVLTAMLAREFGRLAREHTPSPSSIMPDEVYAAGLLHDLGKFLVASRRPRDWKAITDLALRENLALYLAEDAYWGIDHSIAGARLLVFWQLPSRLTEPVCWHHVPSLADPEHRNASLLLAAANITADAVKKAGMRPVLPDEARDMLFPEITGETLLCRIEAVLEKDASSAIAAAFMA